MVKVLDKPTIKIPSEALRKGVVILGLEEYKELEMAMLREKAPVYYLKGRTAKRLDRVVEEGLKEYRQGKLKSVKSLAELR